MVKILLFQSNKANKMGKILPKPKIDGNSSIGKEDLCPICSKFFESSTTFFQVNCKK